MPFRRALAIVAAFAPLACMTKNPDAPPPPVSATVAPIDGGSASAPAASAPPVPSPSRVAPTPQAEWKPGARVVVRGRVSKVVAQHLSAPIAGKHEHDFELEGGGRTVVYAASLPACDGVLELRGAVVELRAPPGSKAGDDHRELQIDVDEARCAP